MTTKEENRLADELLNWYWLNREKIKQNNRFWERNSLGYAFWSIMQEEGRWKQKPRGARHKTFPQKRQLEANNEPDLDF